MTQNNLGNALRRLGEREAGTARLEEAVTIYGEALKVRTRERVPLLWAMTQANLGNAEALLGARKGQAETVCRAIEIGIIAWEVFSTAKASHYEELATKGIQVNLKLMRQRFGEASVARCVAGLTPTHPRSARLLE